MKQGIHFILLLALTIFSACGGSTRGTGGTNSEMALVTITGQLVSETNTPLEGFVITVLETGDSVVTDSNGMYSLAVDYQLTYTLIIETQENSDSSFSADSEVIISNPSDGTNSIDADLVLDTAQGTIEIAPEERRL